MSKLDQGFWERYSMREWVPQIDAFTTFLTNKIVPQFNNLEQEAQQLSDDNYESLCQYCNENTEPEAIVQKAFEKGLGYYENMMALQQGIINLFAIGLYHLFEQQLVLFFRRQILHPSEEDNFRLLTMKNIIARFKVLDIDITTLPSWEKIIKLKLIANCVKHADGSSCEELKELHPNLISSFKVIFTIRRRIKPPTWTRLHAYGR